MRLLALLALLLAGKAGASSASYGPFTASTGTIFVATGSFTGATADTIISMSPSRSLLSSPVVTSIGVTAGKTLQIRSWCCTWRNNTAAAGGVTCTLRASPSGATTASSMILGMLNASTALATIGSGITVCERTEINLSGNMTWGVSQQAVGAVIGGTVTVRGSEY